MFIISAELEYVKCVPWCLLLPLHFRCNTFVIQKFHQDVNPDKQKIKCCKFMCLMGYLLPMYQKGVFTLMPSCYTESWSLNPREVERTVMPLRLRNLLVSTDILFGQQNQSWVISQ